MSRTGAENLYAQRLVENTHLQEVLKTNEDIKKQLNNERLDSYRKEIVDLARNRIAELKKTSVENNKKTSKTSTLTKAFDNSVLSEMKGLGEMKEITSLSKERTREYKTDLKKPLESENRALQGERRVLQNIDTVSQRQMNRDLKHLKPQERKVFVEQHRTQGKEAVSQALSERMKKIRENRGKINEIEKP